jgi:hypothetical protein
MLVKINWLCSRAINFVGIKLHRPLVQSGQKDRPSKLPNFCKAAKITNTNPIISLLVEWALFQLFCHFSQSHGVYRFSNFAFEMYFK